MPSRTIIPELKKRWPNLTSIEVTDRTTPSEYELIRALTKRADVVIAGVFVRIASYSGRMDLSPAQIALLDSIAEQKKPFVTVCFGNPYTADVPAEAARRSCSGTSSRTSPSGRR